MSILDLRTDDSLAAAPGYMQPRKPEAPMSWGGLFSAPFRGIGEAGAQVWASALEVATSYGDIMARVDDGRSLTDRDMLVETDISKAMREAGRSLRPDPETASTAEQIIYGFARGATKVVGGSILAGPFGAVGAGVEEGISAADDLKREGVDLVTRMQAGGVQGAGLALAALPLLGTTIGKTAALYVAGGPGGFIAQQALTREILQGAGYDELGDSYDPFDPVGLAVSSLIPAVFTAAGLRAGAKRARVSKEVSDAARVAYEIEQRNATSPVSRDEFAAVAKHAEALAKAEEQVARGEPVQVADVAPSLTPEQRSANFKAWSMDAPLIPAMSGHQFQTGTPVVADAFHGTTRDFDSFSNGTLGEKTGGADARAGHFLSDNPGAADQFTWENGDKSGHIMPAYVRLLNPLVSDHFLNGSTGTAAGKIIEEAKRAGHDGVIFQRSDMLGNQGATFVAFDPKQIKSAIGNSGRFDPNSPSLTDPIAQLGAAVEELRAARAELDGSARPDSPDQVAQPRQPAEANVGTPRDLQAEMISLRKSQAVLNRLLECIG